MWNGDVWGMWGVVPAVGRCIVGLAEGANSLMQGVVDVGEDGAGGGGYVVCMYSPSIEYPISSSLSAALPWSSEFKHAWLDVGTIGSRTNGVIAELVMVFG
jgi:hypothetical protein